MSTELALLPSEIDRDCLICLRPATCRNYGVMSCDACKMFFRRTILRNLTYTCKNMQTCLDHLSTTKSLCRSCRFQKCLDLGMQFIPKAMNILEIENKHSREFASVIKDLITMDASVHLRFLNFHTEDDPNLEDILGGRKLTLVRRTPQQRVSPQQWSFFGTIVFISFMHFEFVRQLLPVDQVNLFRQSSVKVCALRAAIKNIRANHDRFVTPDGQETYPEEIVNVLRVDPMIMKRICSLLVSRMIELEVTDEEFVLLQMIFFCNPATSNLSESAQAVLSVQQKTYNSVLLHYCQIQYQHSAPSRLTDLLSLYQIIEKTFADLQYITMIFQSSAPNFQFHKLAIETFQLPESMQRLKTENPEPDVSRNADEANDHHSGTS